MVVSGNLYPQSKTLSLGRALISHRPLVSVLWTSWTRYLVQSRGVDSYDFFFVGGGGVGFLFIFCVYHSNVNFLRPYVSYLWFFPQCLNIGTDIY